MRHGQKAHAGSELGTKSMRNRSAVRAFRTRQELQRLQIRTRPKPARDCDGNLSFVLRISTHSSRTHTSYRWCQTNMMKPFSLNVKSANSIYSTGLQLDLSKLTLMSQGMQLLTWFVNTNINYLRQPYARKGQPAPTLLCPQVCTSRAFPAMHLLS
jgi:hypothetical protein